MGNLEKIASDTDDFDSRPLYTREPLQKYNFLKRWMQEEEYARLLEKAVRDFEPDVFLACTGPTEPHRRVLNLCRKNGQRFVFWLQDVNGLAAYKVLNKKLPGLGRLVGTYFIQIEKSMLCHSNRVVLISKEFCPLVEEWGVSSNLVDIIPNWAPLTEIPQRPRLNPFSSKLGLQEKFVFLYSGSLGLKHNPDMLFQLALHYRKNENVRIIVISEGLGADWLVKNKIQNKIENLIILPYQPFDQLPDVMASADVLVSILRPDAGLFSVPSKTNTYLCAGRPLLLSVPLENLAARIVTSSIAGLVVPPEDLAAFIKAADQLYNQPELRRQMGVNARLYAEKYFDIQSITDHFEKILRG